MVVERAPSSSSNGPVRGKDALGAYGEELAARYLLDSGWTIVARNWRCPAGEIDIIAREGAELVICEVKTRSGLRFGTPLEAVTPAKASRLRRLALHWLSSQHCYVPSTRFDVVGVLCSHDGDVSVQHRRGVF